MRRVTVLMVIAVVAAACGGTATTETTDAESVAETTAAEPAAGTEDPTPTTSSGTASTTEDETDGGETSDLTGTGAVVTIGDDTYQFRLTENGRCDPDFLGGFQAFLTRVDDSGTPMEIPGEPELTQGITISVSPTGEGVIAAGIDGVAWVAGSEDYPGGSIDSAEFDGVGVRGTATFVSETGDGPFEGTFEAACVEGTASGGGGEFCEAVENAIAFDDDLGLDDPEISRLLPEAVDQLDALRSIAPDDLGGDVDILYGALLRMDTLLDEYGYDSSAVPEQELESLAGPQVEAAALRIVGYCS